MQALKSGTVIGMPSGNIKVIDFFEFLSMIRLNKQAESKFVQHTRSDVYDPRTYNRVGNYLTPVSNEVNFLRDQVLSKIDIVDFDTKSVQEYKDIMSKRVFRVDNLDPLFILFEETFVNNNIKFAEEMGDGHLVILPPHRELPRLSLMIQTFMFCDLRDWEFHTTGETGKVCCYYPERSARAFQINLIKDIE